MSKKTTLEPQIIQHLKDNGNTPLDNLIGSLHKKTGVPVKKIDFRIRKMIIENKLGSDNGVISIKRVSDLQKADYDEFFDYGPIKLARKGKAVLVQSNWQKGEHEKFKKKAETSLPALKKELEQKYQDIEKLILEKFDPLDVLAYISAKNLLIDPETETESSFQGKQIIPETIQNIILKNTLNKYKTVSNRDVINEIEKPLDELFSKLIWYHIYEAETRKNLSDIEKEIYFHVLTNFLIVRGDAYPQHYKQISVGLFSKINHILKKKGFSIEEYWSTVEEIERQINYNYNEPKRKLHEEHSKFVDFCKKEQEKGTNPKEILEIYRKDLNSRSEDFQQDINKLSEICLKGSFEIEITTKINQKLLDLLSMNFGDNAAWNNTLDKSDITIRPIIKTDDKYYCFLVQHLIRNAVPIIESKLTKDAKSQVDYHKTKGDYFEEKALELLGKLIKGQIYPKLKYPKRNENEIDGIIVLDDLVFLIEVKGKKKRIIAGVNDVLKLTKDDFNAHINEAFEQTKKALEYIQSKDIVEFKNEQGNTVLQLKKDSIKRIFLINVCTENFSKLALDINLVKSWDTQLFKGNQYPWVVSIYDLLVISELLENNSDFIQYLSQRIDIAKNYDLKAVDELDFFGYFLDHGNLNREESLKEINNQLIHGYSEKIDRWYSYLRGEVGSAEKPTHKK